MKPDKQVKPGKKEKQEQECRHLDGALIPRERYSAGEDCFLAAQCADCEEWVFVAGTKLELMG